jgi:hypothetical protein
MRGYPEHYYFALGHLAEAEDELSKHHSDLAKVLRQNRKNLEAHQEYDYPFTETILTVAKQGERETEERVKVIESSFEGKSRDDLLEWWENMQS